MISRIVYGIWIKDAERKYHWVKDWLGSDDNLLEVGSGPGSVLEVFRNHGHQVTGLDIRNNAIHSGLNPVIYDGIRMPFEDEEFDCALLLTMLHHTPDPDVIVKEAARVARRLVIIEDVYDTPIQAAYTKIADSVINLEFRGHPHSNRSNNEWLRSFERLGLTPRYTHIHPLLKIFQQAVYILDKKDRK